MNAAQWLWFWGCCLIWVVLFGLMYATTEEWTWATVGFWWVIIALFGTFINPLRR